MTDRPDNLSNNVRYLDKHFSCFLLCININNDLIYRKELYTRYVFSCFVQM